MDCFFKSNIKRVKLDQPSCFYFWSRTTLLFQDYAGDPGLRCWSRTTLLVQDCAAGPGLRCWSRTTLLVQDYAACPGLRCWSRNTLLVQDYAAGPGLHCRSRTTVLACDYKSRENLTYQDGSEKNSEKCIIFLPCWIRNPNLLLERSSRKEEEDEEGPEGALYALIWGMNEPQNHQRDLSNVSP